MIDVALARARIRVRRQDVLSHAQTLWRSPYLLLTFAPILMAGNFIVGRTLRGDVPPVTLNFWRWLAALAILLPLSYGELRRKRAEIRQGWKVILGIGACGVAGFQLITYQALTMTTVINASLVLATGPLAIALCAWLLFRETITLRQTVGLLGAVFGAVAVVARGDLSSLLVMQFNTGDLLMVVGIVAMAVASVLLKRRPPGLSPLALHTSTVAAGVLVMLPLYIWQAIAGERLVLSVPNLIGVGYAAVFSSVIAFLAWTRGNMAIGPTRAGVFTNLVPIFAALAAVMFLDEPIAAYHLVGALLVFGGVGMASWPAPNKQGENS